MSIHTLSDFFLYAVKSSATNEKNISGVHMNIILIGMFTPALGRDIHHRTFQQFQQTLLHTFSTHISRDRRIVAFTGDFIYLINEDNPSLGSLDIVVCDL